MSVEAISWALNLAPVPADRGGQPSARASSCSSGLANHAGPDGAGAFPSVATLVRSPACRGGGYAPAWTRLEAEGIVRLGDPH